MTMRLVGVLAMGLLQQSSTLPPEGAAAVATVQGRGVQIYRCSASTWSFQGPEAELFDAAGMVAGKHGAGPSWTWSDGSSVQGKALVKVASPDAGSVPWLLVEAHSVGGAGVLAPVRYVRRSETVGGNAPSAGCDAGQEGTTLRVPYEATYTFYR